MLAVALALHLLVLVEPNYVYVHMPQGESMSIRDYWSLKPMWTVYATEHSDSEVIDLDNLVWYRKYVVEFRGKINRDVPLKIDELVLWSKGEARDVVEAYLNCALQRFNTNDSSNIGDINIYSQIWPGPFWLRPNVYWEVVKARGDTPLWLGCVTVPVGKRIDVKVRGPEENTWSYGIEIAPKDHPVKVCLFGARNERADFMISFPESADDDFPVYFFLRPYSFYHVFGDCVGCAASVIMQSLIEKVE